MKALYDHEPESEDEEESHPLVLLAVEIIGLIEKKMKVIYHLVSQT